MDSVGAALLVYSYKPKLPDTQTVHYLRQVQQLRKLSIKTRDCERDGNMTDAISIALMCVNG